MGGFITVLLLLLFCIWMMVDSYKQFKRKLDREEDDRRRAANLAELSNSHF